MRPDLILGLLLAAGEHTPPLELRQAPAGRFAVDGEVRAIAISPDGSLVVAAGRGRRVLLWDVAKGASTLVDAGGTVSSLAFSSDRRGFYVGTQDGWLAAFTRDGRQLWRAQAGGKPIRCVAVSPDAALLATGSEDGRLSLWQASDGKLFREVGRHAKEVVGVGFASGGRRLLSFDDHDYHAWHTFAFAAAAAPGPPDSPLKGAFHTFAAAVTDDHVAVVGQYRYQGKGELSSANRGGMGFIQEDDHIMVYHGSQRKPEHTIRPELVTNNIRDVALTTDSRFMAVVTERGLDKKRGTAIVWEIEKEEPRLVLDLEAAGRAVALSADGRLLGAGDARGNVFLFRIEGMETDLSETVVALVPDANSSCRPAITIEEPAAARGLRVGSSEPLAAKARSLLVRGQAEDPCGKGVSAVWINGERITALDKAGSAGVRFAGYVELGEGDQEIRLRALGLDSGESTLSFKVRASLPTAQQLKAAGMVRGRALVVGISKYRDASINLGFADRDAKGFAAFLGAGRGLAGFAGDALSVLLNEAATRTALANGLETFLGGAQENEVTMLFFAGHGAPAQTPGGAEKLYLIPHDVRLDDIPASAYPMSSVLQLLSSLRARHLIVFVDACHSAGIGGEDIAALGRSRRLPGAGAPTDINGEFLRRIAHAAPSRVVFASAERNQLAFEPAELRAGVFTYFLQKGLGGEADENGDHVVALGELLEYVRTSVRHYTKGRQVPAISPTSFDRDLPLAFVE